MPRRLLVCALSAFAAVIPRPVRAETPSAGDGPSPEDFTIVYQVTDEEGEPSRDMNLQDMMQFVNRARCECGQEIAAEIRLVDRMLNNTQLATFVGNACGEGLEGGNQARPCAQVGAGFSEDFQTTKTYRFHPLWLHSGVVRGTSQDINVATPFLSCDSGQASGGIWMCAEDGTQTGCQQEEFFITGSTNNNVPMGNDAQGITYDFTPPQSTVSDLKLVPGDGAVQVSWTLEGVADVNGFRVLCSLANGDPVPGKGIDGSPADQFRADLYYTRETLCPDGPFTPNPAGDSDDGGTSDGGTDGGDSNPDDGTVDRPGGFSANNPNEVELADSGTGATATDSASETGTETGSQTDPGGSAGDPDIASDQPLDYAYVCSKHLGATTSRTRVSGLENNVEHRFWLVAYDGSGNPAVVSPLGTATPEVTYDLWDECSQEDPPSCGQGGFCNCRADRSLSPIDHALAILLVAGGFVRRRRGKDRPVL